MLVSSVRSYRPPEMRAESDSAETNFSFVRSDVEAASLLLLLRLPKRTERSFVERTVPLTHSSSSSCAASSFSVRSTAPATTTPAAPASFRRRSRLSVRRSPSVGPRVTRPERREGISCNSITKRNELEILTLQRERETKSILRNGKVDKKRAKSGQSDLITNPLEIVLRAGWREGWWLGRSSRLLRWRRVGKSVYSGCIHGPTDGRPSILPSLPLRVRVRSGRREGEMKWEGRDTERGS